MERALTKAEMSAAFNEWMRRFIDESERFEREWQSVQKFVAQDSSGKTPTYGDECSA